MVARFTPSGKAFSSTVLLAQGLVNRKMFRLDITTTCFFFFTQTGGGRCFSVLLSSFPSASYSTAYFPRRFIFVAETGVLKSPSLFRLLLRTFIPLRTDRRGITFFWAFPGRADPLSGPPFTPPSYPSSPPPFFPLAALFSS